MALNSLVIVNTKPTVDIEKRITHSLIYCVSHLDDVI